MTLSKEVEELDGLPLNKKQQVQTLLDLKEDQIKELLAQAANMGITIVGLEEQLKKLESSAQEEHKSKPKKKND